MHQTIKKCLLISIIFFNGVVVRSEPIKIKDVSGEQRITNVYVLPDKGYKFEEVRTNSTLAFRKTDSLAGASSYWVKLALYNPSYKPQSFNIIIKPNFENTLYSYSPTLKKWIEQPFNNVNKIRLMGQSGPAYQVGGLQYDTLYVKVNVHAPHTSTGLFHLKVSIIPEAVTDQRTLNSIISWVVGTVVLLLFFLNNLYIYFSFKDRTIIYYLIMQLCGIFYLATIHSSFSRLFSFGSFNSLLEVEDYRFYTIDHVIMHLAIAGLFYGLIQLTRSYLNTRILLPNWDKLLKHGLNIFAVISFLLITVNVFGVYIESYTLPYDNMLCLALIVTVTTASVISYARKTPTARPFLLANILPLVFLFAVTLYNIFLSDDRHFNHWLPVLAACSQALSFSVALVTRTKAIRSDLVAKEIESRQLTFDLKEVEYQNQLKEKEIQQHNADMKSQRYQNELLQDKVEAHQRELASSTLFMVQKTELLTNLKGQIGELKRSDRYHFAKNLDNMLAMLDNSNQLDLEWDKFKLHFEQVHPNFFEDLRKQHPTLTQKETRLYAYFEMKLSHKEIATLLNIDPASVRRAKTRLLKKMAVTHDLPEDQEGDDGSL